MFTRKLIVVAVAEAIASGCKTDQQPIETSRNTFSEELAQFKNYFHIPGLSVVVEQIGQNRL
jgi:hypothetical protein